MYTSTLFKIVALYEDSAMRKASLILFIGEGEVTYLSLLVMWSRYPPPGCASEGLVLHCSFSYLPARQSTAVVYGCHGRQALEGNQAGIPRWAQRQVCHLQMKEKVGVRDGI